ncbi:MAG TPA: amidohydrolase/deacetylase family metallohydrolase [Acidimicrobiales bacterium]|nr:amidohydrolase/deacetylase family metallohydrolase [Acidimicrobiales bacterium]
MTSHHDLLLRGGTLIDPSAGESRKADIAVDGSTITAIAPAMDATAARVLDCEGAFVSPGLIDSHTHIFSEVSKVGAPVDEAHLRRGVVAACDAGTAGASTFAAFKHHVADASRTRVLSFLNVSVLGLIDFRFGELLNPATLVGEDAVAVASAHPDIVRGLKIRLSTDVVGQQCLELLTKAVEVGEEARLPLMVHIGETAAPLKDILTLLRPGDVVAHCYTGKENNILEDGEVSDAVWDARGRGVLFECAHGKSNFSFEVARPAIEQGFLPDIVCSDTSYRNWNGPVFDLLTTMSKLVALGVPLEEVVRLATVSPARTLGLWDEGFGRVEVGGAAHLSVFELLEDEDQLPDAAGHSISARRLDARWTVLGGDPIAPLPWRGTVPSRS